MPLNNHPSVKPTYDFYDTVTDGRDGDRERRDAGSSPGARRPRPADANFPAGSRTWHWHSPEPIANYLVENSIGSYDLTARPAPTAIRVLRGAGQRDHRRAQGDQQDRDGQAGGHHQLPDHVQRPVPVHAPPASSSASRRRASRRRCRRRSPSRRRSAANGTSLGHVQPREHAPVVRRQRLRGRLQPHRSGRRASPRSASTSPRRAGARPRPAGSAPRRRRRVREQPGRPLQHELRHDEPALLDRRAVEPDGRQPVRDGEHLHPARARRTSRCWRILGRDRMIATMKQIQRDFGGGNITEPQLEAEFHAALPNQSARAAGAARPVLHAVVRHRVPDRRRRATSRRSPGPG